MILHRAACEHMPASRTRHFGRDRPGLPGTRRHAAHYTGFSKTHTTVPAPREMLSDGKLLSELAVQ
ncbi:hypothetical protein P7K49_012222, partial [Saguinus oedipus]